MEAQETTDRETKEPITGQVDEHRNPRVAETAERSGSHGLNGIEELEGGGNDQQRRAHFQNAPVLGIDPKDGARNRQKQAGSAKGKDTGDTECDKSVMAGKPEVLTAKGVPYRESSRRPDAKGNHEAYRGNVDRNLMSSQDSGREPSGQK